MPSFRSWADLPPELLCRIGDGLADLRCYGSARGACTAWRRALAPRSPFLLVVHGDARCFPSAASLPTGRSFMLQHIPSGARCVGSTSGWLALSAGAYYGHTTFSLFNPVTAVEIVLPPLIYKGRWAPKSKLVFRPNPASDDFAAAAICEVDRLAYVTARAKRWAILDPVPLAHGDQLVDVVFHEKNGRGLVYCLTCYGDVHVLRLPERCRRKPMDDPSSKPHSLLSPAEQQHAMIRRRSAGPDLNVPATVEPLMSLTFDPATSFAPPYNTVSPYTSAKNLVFCDGNLYQVWRNASCTVTVKLPGGGHRRVAENEVFVLRYYARRHPCWDAVTDLGGYSMFLGTNNAVWMHAEGGGVPGIKGNCIYWIGGRGRDQGMVFDMATGRTTACVLPPPAAGQNTICWYFLSDKCGSNGGKRVYQTRARVRADREKQQDIKE